MADFSAQVYIDMNASDPEVFNAAAKKLGVDLSRIPAGNEQIDAVYNAALYLVSTGRGEEVFGNPPVDMVAEPPSTQDVIDEDAVDDLVGDDNPADNAIVVDLDQMTKAQLKAHAAKANIDLGNATSNADIIKVIRDAEGRG